MGREVFMYCGKYIMQYNTNTILKDADMFVDQKI